jgi:hypothetical protein
MLFPKAFIWRLLARVRFANLLHRPFFPFQADLPAPFSSSFLPGLTGHKPNILFDSGQPGRLRLYLYTSVRAFLFLFVEDFSFF